MTRTSRRVAWLGGALIAGLAIAGCASTHAPGPTAAAKPAPAAPTPALVPGVALVEGHCPAELMRPGVRSTGPDAPKAVVDVELSSLDLKPELPTVGGIDARRLRLRRLEVAPGGIVPWHGHADRPALILTVQGAIVEYRSDCEAGVVHRAGSISNEASGVFHWWRNEGDTTAILIAADLKNG